MGFLNLLRSFFRKESKSTSATKSETKKATTRRVANKGLTRVWNDVPSDNGYSYPVEHSNLGSALDDILNPVSPMNVFRDDDTQSETNTRDHYTPSESTDYSWTNDTTTSHNDSDSSFSSDSSYSDSGGSFGD